jgi:hypothetical protein
MKDDLYDLFGTVGSSDDLAWRDLSPGNVGGEKLIVTIA